MDLRKSIGQKIKHHRKSRGMNQEDLADMLGTTKQTISRYENGERQANQDILFQLSNIFKISIDNLFPDREVKRHQSRDYNYYPNPVAAGLPENVESITKNNIKKISIPDELMGRHAGNDDIYITRVNGESMNKVIAHNSLIAVKPVEPSNLKNGDIVIYNYNNEYSAKRFYKQGNEVIFRPDTTDMSFRDHVIDLDNNIDLKIKGKVVLWVTEAD